MNLPVARPQSDPTIRVQIPTGVAAGGQFVVRLESGENFAVTAPPGSRPGDFLDIIIPPHTPPSAGGGSDISADNVKLTKAQIGLAGAGAAAGLLLAGPITACALAGAGAYAASKDGTAAKEMGKKAFDFGKRAAEAAKEKLTEAAQHLAAEAERRRQIGNNGAGGQPLPLAIAHPIP